MKFLPHNKLGITFEEHGALIAVYTMLKNGMLSYHPTTDTWEDQLSKKMEKGFHMFNMETFCKTKHCGSIGCIGGNMAIIMGRDPTDYVHDYDHDYDGVLQKLFYPTNKHGVEYDFKPIKPAEALKVIEYFLRTGKVNWYRVLENKYKQKD